VYGGLHPITKQRIRFRKTVKTEVAAQIALGKLLEQVLAGKEPESGATVSQLLDHYGQVAEWDVSTRESFEGYIRRTIKPGLGHLQVRKVRGPILDMLYARLKKCGDLACNGKPFTEHRNVPDLRPARDDRRQPWQQVADKLRAAITSGSLPAGSPLPSVRDLQALQGIRRSTLQHAFTVLADEGLIIVRQGRAGVVAGAPDEPDAAGVRQWRPGRRHDCALAGCQRHACRPMKPATIRQVHSILSGAFQAAERWGWVDGNPAESAKPPTITQSKRSATPPEDVAKVIAQARASGRPLLALYIWLAAITGARRGELCAVQLSDLSLEHGNIHVAFNYLVKGGEKVRKDTKTHQDRWLALDPVSCALIGEAVEELQARLRTVGLSLPPGAYLFSNDPMHSAPWNPDWVSHQVSDVAGEAGISLNVKGLRHYTASQLLAARFDLQNTAARLGHGGGGATTLKHYADPVSEVDRRAAAYLAELTGTAGTGVSQGARV
jgi:integrase/DNA-binding transcriptional regulator YhcF (GntR family)